jgi:uncharacterized DUF497 family protein
MKKYLWSDEKNEWLKHNRGISFEQIVAHLETEDLLDTIDHDRQEKYPEQRIFIVAISGYAWLLPFVESEGVVFLKTAIPSRKMTRQYLGREKK